MPVYNERATLISAIKDVLNVNFPCEIELVIVDDGSTDGTRDLYSSLGDDPRLSIQMHKRHQGKGAAIRTAAPVATGDYIIMCDADLEYSPAEIPSLLAPVLAEEAEVVYGTRTFGSHNSYSYAYVLSNKADPRARIRHGSRDHRQAAAPRHPAVRGADHLQGAHPRGREEAHLARRRGSAVDPAQGAEHAAPGPLITGLPELGVRSSSPCAQRATTGR